MRCRPWIVRLRLHRGGLACNSSLGESQINKLNRASGPSSGQPDNRMLNEPCARRQIRFFWTRLEKASVCSAEPQLYMELSAWLTGIGFEDRGKRDILNCGDGDIAACSSLDQGSPESKSLFCTNLRETITGRDVCPMVQEITAMEGGWQLRRPAERTLLITAAFLHCASLRDCQHDVATRIQIKKWHARFGRNLLCLFRGGEQIPAGSAGPYRARKL